MTSTIYSPLCLRFNPETDNGEGFFFVDTGLIVIDHATKCMRVYEHDEWSSGVANIRFEVELKRNDIQLRFRIIRSGHSNFEGGRLQLKGIFDRGYYEILTFKMPTQEFYRLTTVINNLGI